jgi:hypothetical protein
MKPRTKMKTEILLLSLLGYAILSNVSALAVAQDITKETSSYAERLPPKIQKNQKELPAWIEMQGNKEKAAAFMQKLKEHLDAKNFAEAEKTADSILKMMGLSAPAAGQGTDNKSQAPPPFSPPSGDTVKRLTAKVERAKAGTQKWATSGRDPSTIVKAMEEKFKPLMDAGKVVEAEAELDRILEQLGEKKTEGASADATAVPQDASSYEERLPPKIHRIQKELPAWSEKPGNKEKAAAFMQKLKEQLDAMNFVEAEKTADSILKTMGITVPAAWQGSDKKPQPTPPTGSRSDETVKRLTEKVERVKAGAQKWAASGRDPSAIGQAMEEKFKPLMEAGKVVEAEAELDRVLEQLNKDAK